MDEISRCKNQLASFRIKELKDVLTRLGLPKQGKKQVLMDKIMAVLAPAEWQHPLPHRAKPGSVRSSVTREEAAKVIDDIYRKLRGPGAAVELASLHRNVSAASLGAARSDEQEEGNAWEVRCPCGISSDVGTTIQCENTACNVWQHLSCVVIPEKPVEGVEPDVPNQFYCDICRIKFCDPFCVTISHPLYPVKFCAPPGLKMEGASPMHGLERSFTLSKHDRDILHKPNHDLQVWCLLLDDKVPFRMHWPAFADLRVNGVAVRVHNRAGTQLLGVNGRDDGPGIITCTREGSNRISFQACDARPFCIGVRIIRRLTVDQVMNLIPSAAAGETFEEALARVNRCINGSGGDAGEDDDSDLEVVAESVTVNLSCPMSGSRINTAGRFKPCGHMGGFDLRTFVEMNQRTRKWQCPVCMKNYTLEQLIIDPFFNRIAQAMKGYNEDIKEVELKADGFWRPKLEGDVRSKEPWRHPDGSFVLANGVQKAATVVKREEDVRRPLKIGIKRTHDGTWAVNKSINRPWSTKEPIKAKEVSSRSSSATDSNNEDDTRSVNQEPYRDEYIGENGAGAESLPWTKKSKPTAVPQAPPKENGGDVIVLTDSDEESGSPGGTFNHQQHQRTPPPRSTNGTVNLPSEDAIGLASHWSQQPQYGFFGSNATESSDYARESLPEYGVTGSGFNQEEDDEMETSKGGFRMFLPPQPAREQPQSTQRRHVVAADEELDDSWFSLSLGGGDNLNPDHQFLRDRSTTVGNYNNHININNHNNGSCSSIRSRRNHPSENCYRVQDESCSE